MNYLKINTFEFEAIIACSRDFCLWWLLIRAGTNPIFASPSQIPINSTLFDMYTATASPF